MRHTAKFRKFCLAIASLYAAVAMAITPQEAVRIFSETPRLPAGSMAVLVSELPSGKVIASYNTDSPLIPASIMKSVTLASLSEVADVDSPILTAVYAEGEIGSDGTLRGNLIVVGAGDPSLNSGVAPLSDEFNAEIVKALKREGIRNIEGTIIVDESYLKGPAIPASWASGDLPHSYGTGSHSFNYSNNSAGNSSVKDPAGVFRSDLTRMLGREGIAIGTVALDNAGPRRKLTEHVSPPLKDILRSCMMRSDNMYAETSLRLFGKNQGGDGSTADAAGRETEFWRERRAPFDGVKIVDGSGLSRSNKVTAKFMESVLRNKADDVEYVSFFPLAGQEGTLKKFLSGTPLDSYIALKTGSMNGIQCYAGYKLDDDFAPTHVAVIMVNDFRCERSYLRTQIERMLLEIFSDENMIDRTFTKPNKTIPDYAE